MVLDSQGGVGVTAFTVGHPHRISTRSGCGVYCGRCRRRKGDSTQRPDIRVARILRKRTATRLCRQNGRLLTVRTNDVVVGGEAERRHQIGRHLYRGCIATGIVVRHRHRIDTRSGDRKCLQYAFCLRTVIPVVRISARSCQFCRLAIALADGQTRRRRRDRHHRQCVHMDSDRVGAMTAISVHTRNHVGVVSRCLSIVERGVGTSIILQIIVVDGSRSRCPSEVRGEQVRLSGYESGQACRAVETDGGVVISDHLDWNIQVH